MSKSMIPNILSIAGSDPSGGAGIQADLKAISANGGYGMAALTALTAQNTRGVQAVLALDPDFLRQQLQSIFDDIRVDAIKIGVVANASLAGVIADVLADHPVPHVVLDPVMVAKGGDRLLAEDAIATIRERLLPLATIITPNLPEAAVLIDSDVDITERDAMIGAARQLQMMGARAVLMKGGHLADSTSPDYLLTPAGDQWFEAPRIATDNTHGTGCTLSAALATRLALTGGDMVRAVSEAKAYLGGAIAAAGQLDVGHGHGPTHHFWYAS
tara:strand:+ start:9021 stop:9836 length:816 start_codon:yes stop_codon:yes gene_type:complete